MNSFFFLYQLCIIFFLSVVSLHTSAVKMLQLAVMTMTIATAVASGCMFGTCGIFGKRFFQPLYFLVCIILLSLATAVNMVCANNFDKQVRKLHTSWIMLTFFQARHHFYLDVLFWWMWLLPSSKTCSPSAVSRDPAFTLSCDP